MVSLREPPAWSRLLEELRHALNLSPTEFAQIADIDRRTYETWRHAEVEAPHDSRLRQVGERFLTPPTELPPSLLAKLQRGAAVVNLEVAFGQITHQADLARETARSTRARVAGAQRQLELSVADLQSALGQVPSIGRWPETKVRAMTAVYTQDFEARLRFEERLLQDLRSARTDDSMQPLLSSLAAPAFITRPWSYQAKRQTEMYRRREARQISELLAARYDAWHGLARVGQIRWLIDVRGHEDYFQDSLRAGSLTRDELRAQVNETLRLLDEYDGHLRVAMQRDRIPMTYSVFGHNSATIYGHTYPPAHEVSLHGIRGVVTNDPTTVIGLRLSFEGDWQKWSKRDSQTAVRRWLSTLAQLTLTSSNQGL